MKDLDNIVLPAWSNSIYIRLGGSDSLKSTKFFENTEIRRDGFLHYLYRIGLKRFDEKSVFKMHSKGGIFGDALCMLCEFLDNKLNVICKIKEVDFKWNKNDVVITVSVKGRGSKDLVIRQNIDKFSEQYPQLFPDISSGTISQMKLYRPITDLLRSHGKMMADLRIENKNPNFLALLAVLFFPNFSFVWEDIRREFFIELSQNFAVLKLFDYKVKVPGLLGVMVALMGRLIFGGLESFRVKIFENLGFRPY